MTPRLAMITGTLASVIGLSACASTYDVAIETRVNAEVDTSAFQRILIAGFVTADRPEDLDLNIETTRLLRSQFRSKTSLRVVESADILPVADEATRANEDLQAREGIFANSTFWKRLGEEYLNPLILTGTVRFVPEARAGFTPRDREEFDSVGRRRLTVERVYAPTTGYRLTPTFILIDGRTGVVLHTDTFHEEVFYDQNQQIPALSCYFELMDRIVPAVLTMVSDQTIRVPRVLLK
jgi:hypothetical protein